MRSLKERAVRGEGAERERGFGRRGGGGGGNDGGGGGAVDVRANGRSDGWGA